MSSEADTNSTPRHEVAAWKTVLDGVARFEKSTYSRSNHEGKPGARGDDVAPCVRVDRDAVLEEYAGKDCNYCRRVLDTAIFTLANDAIVVSRNQVNALTREVTTSGRTDNVGKLYSDKPWTRTSYRLDEITPAFVDGILSSLKGDDGPTMYEVRMHRANMLFEIVKRMSDRFGGSAGRVEVSRSSDGAPAPDGGPAMESLSTGIVYRNGSPLMLTVRARVDGSCDSKIATIGVVARGRMSDMRSFSEALEDAMTMHFGCTAPSPRM